VAPQSRAEWRAWLQRHHTSADGVWLRFAKKHATTPSPSYNDAVEEALCFGWIDGLVRPCDSSCYEQRFTPRKPRSGWARSNKIRVERLMTQGLMTAAGLAAVSIARENGSWTALDGVEALKVPLELRKALAANAVARTHWRGLSEGKRKQFLYRLASARRDETRARRVAEIVAMVEQRISPAQASIERRRATLGRGR
jgi:uncharacterized protein YdeI (YjbR/CyaY-like superfamily)